MGDNVSDKMLLGGYYAFGPNELHIIAALERVLDDLESLYDVDFERPRLKARGGM